MFNGFNSVAKHYDQIFSQSRIGQAQRKRVFIYINEIITKDEKLSILELNCGTGEDAIAFARLGHDVLATDISEEMIKVAVSKLKFKNLKFNIQDINTIKPEIFKNKFDLIFSNFGGLNCLSRYQLQRFLKTSEMLLKSNGKLIMVIMPKQCLWERVYFMVKGNYKKSKRRNTDKSVSISIRGTDVNTWYYNPKEIIALIQSKFKIKTIKPVGICIPPSYFEKSILTKTPIFNLLIVLESCFNFSFLAKYADHFLIELEKK